MLFILMMVLREQRGFQGFKVKDIHLLNKLNESPNLGFGIKNSHSVMKFMIKLPAGFLALLCKDRETDSPSFSCE